MCCPKCAATRAELAREVLYLRRELDRLRRDHVALEVRVNEIDARPRCNCVPLPYLPAEYPKAPGR